MGCRSDRRGARASSPVRSAGHPGARAFRLVPRPSSAPPAAAARFPLLRLAAERASAAESLASVCRSRRRRRRGSMRPLPSLSPQKAEQPEHVAPAATPHSADEGWLVGWAGWVNGRVHLRHPVEDDGAVAVQVPDDVVHELLLLPPLHELRRGRGAAGAAIGCFRARRRARRSCGCLCVHFFSRVTVGALGGGGCARSGPPSGRRGRSRSRG